MALQDYLATEIGTDHRDGLMTRREALRRLGLLGSAPVPRPPCWPPAATTAGPTAPPPRRPGRRRPRPRARPPRPPPPAPPPPGRPTRRSAPRAPPVRRSPSPARPATLQGVFSAAPTPQGAVLLIHENRGLTDHFKVLPTRFAASGYSALSLDLASRQGGTAAFNDPGHGHRGAGRRARRGAPGRHAGRPRRAGAPGAGRLVGHRRLLLRRWPGVEPARRRRTPPGRRRPLLRAGAGRCRLLRLRGGRARRVRRTGQPGQRQPGGHGGRAHRRPASPTSCARSPASTTPSSTTPASATTPPRRPPPTRRRWTGSASTSEQRPRPALRSRAPG